MSLEFKMIRPLILCVVIASIIGIRDAKNFEVHWNVPTFKCHNDTTNKQFFLELGSKYNITQNVNDTFRGMNITLLYDPGLFPTLVRHNNGDPHVQNGGLPQLGNLTLHESRLNANYTNEKLVPKNFSGLGVIDFESSRPVLQQNWGNLKENKRQAYKYECDVCNSTISANITVGGVQLCGNYSGNCSLESDYCKADIYSYLEDKKSFNETAVNKLLSVNYTKLQNETVKHFGEGLKNFMSKALELAKNLFPNGTWGYYGYPYCYNMNNAQNMSDCKDYIKDQNDNDYKWLFNISTGLYPSVYIKKNLNSTQKTDLIKYRVHEAMRVSQNNRNISVYPYTWYKYNEKKENRTDDMSKDDLELTFKTIYEGGASGLIIWGSSEDLSNKSQCDSFINFVNTTLGDIMKNYTSREVKSIGLITRNITTKVTK